jgi:protein phosphatase
MVVVLSDGMGGQAAGEIASSITVQVIVEVFRQNGFDKPSDYLAFGIQRAHEAILEHTREDSSTSGMGATVVAAVVLPNQIVVGNVGDSRALQFANGYVRRLTQDHLFICDTKGVPENLAKRHPDGHVLSQALGHDGRIVPDILAYDLRSGDTIILCSDGVSEYVDESRMAKIVSQKSLKRVAVEMVEVALAAGTRDNCTVAAILVP